jgi:hypothetical protein
MNGLENTQSSYIILSADRLNEIISVLYSKEYQILPIQCYYKGKFEDSVIAWGPDNESLRRDSIFLLDHFHQECAIIKYNGEQTIKKVFFNGSEQPLNLIMYNTDSENRSYLHNGVSFSFVEAKRYWKPKSAEDLKIGMVVEYMNNNKWFEKKIQNPKDEWDKMYKLLLKYDRLRVSA